MLSTLKLERIRENTTLIFDYQYVIHYKYKKFADSNQDYWNINLEYENVNFIKTTYNYEEYKLDYNINFRNRNLSDEDLEDLITCYTFKNPSLIAWLNHWTMTNYYIIFKF